MMSILPKHIASEVTKDIREEIQQMLANHKSTITKKPFEYVPLCLINCR